MLTSSPVDGFRLAYTRAGGENGGSNNGGGENSGGENGGGENGGGDHRGRPVLLLHGWPGDHTDYRALTPLLADDADVVVPDLRGFGGSDKHPVDPAEGYGADAQARSVAALVEELGLERPVVAGYDVGSRVAQALARRRPDLVHALVVSPPLPGIGRRVLDPRAQAEFWYQSFHQLSLAENLVDGRADAVRAYLRHFWEHWSGPEYMVAETDLDHLVAVYSPPGAFTASIAWYRAGAGSVARSLADTTPDPQDRLATPTAVLWPDHDPLFPREWSDRLGEFFADVTLHPVDGVGHFTPLECPERFAALIRAATR